MHMFSVLLSLYSKENPLFLKQSLDSLFSQTLLPSEVILVKDGPLTAELDTIVSDYKQRHSILKVVALEKNQGLGRALNEGLKCCSCDLVARMDTDDVAKPNRFEKQLKVFTQYPNLDVVSAWVDEFEGDVSNIISVRKLPASHSEIYSFAQFRCPVNHPVVMFRKQAVINAGGYMHMPLLEDYYLWVRMLLNGSKFYNIQESLLYFRFSPQMFKRRGGWQYAVYEYHFFNQIRKLGFISFFQFIKNILSHCIVRILPNSLRSILYKKVIRGKQ